MISKNKGFTLIELLVAIAIILVIGSIAMLSLSSAKAKGRDSARMQAIVQINKAISMYTLNNGTPPDLGNINCLNISLPNPDCVADQATHPENWLVLEQQLSPYIPKLELDPCPSCTADVWNISKVAYAAENINYDFVYEAPAATAAYLQANNLSTAGLTNQGYRIYAKKLESENSMFGYGFSLNGIAPIVTSNTDNLPPNCPYDNKNQCDEWQKSVDEYTVKCKDGDQEACDWLKKNGIDISSDDSKCPYENEEDCANWQKLVDEYTVSCQNGDKEACDWLKNNGIDVPNTSAKCPYNDEVACKEWQENVDNNTLKCQGGDEEACKWLSDNGVSLPENKSNTEQSSER